MGAQLLLAGGVAKTMEEAESSLRAALNSGAGLRKLKEMIAAQGGDPRVCDDTGLLPQAPVIVPVTAPVHGYLSQVDCTALGLAARGLGAGRMKRGDAASPRGAATSAAAPAGGRGTAALPGRHT